MTWCVKRHFRIPIASPEYIPEIFFREEYKINFLKNILHHLEFTGACSDLDEISFPYLLDSCRRFEKIQLALLSILQPKPRTKYCVIHLSILNQVHEKEEIS